MSVSMRMPHGWCIVYDSSYYYSTYYGGESYTTSTSSSAYLLMYRRVDRARNMAAVADSEIPEDVRQEVLADNAALACEIADWEGRKDELKVWSPGDQTSSEQGRWLDRDTRWRTLAHVLGPFVRLPLASL